MPLAPVRFLVGGRREFAEHRLDVAAVLPNALVQFIFGEVTRRQVPEVLVDPVRGQRADDALLPPRRGLDFGAPGLRGVPVVPDVVVVEDHRRRHRRHQPAHLRVRPRLGVEPGVLLEIAHLRPRWLVHVVDLGDPGLGLGGEFVGVHLIPEQQQGVGPLVRRLFGHPHRIRVQASAPRCRLSSVVDIVANRHDPNVRTSVSSSSRSVRIIEGTALGNGHTGRPSRATSYGVVDPGSRPSTTTSA